MPDRSLFRRCGLLIVAALAVSTTVSCSPAPLPTTTTTSAPAPTPATTSTTTNAPTTTLPPTTAAPEETTTSTVTSPIRRLEVTGDVPDPLLDEVGTVMNYATDVRNALPAVPDGMLEYLAGVTLPAATVARFEASLVELQNGDTVAVVWRRDDTLFAVEEAGTWRIVGARLGNAPPWLGTAPRLLLVLGSDARRGQNQLRYRADSIHLVSVVPGLERGAIVGFPRDTLVPGPEGDIKFSSLMAGRGPEIMLDTTRELTGLPVEGYVVTGFTGFEGLIEALGGLVIDLPNLLRSGNDWDDFAAGLQRLDPTRALQLARIRKGLPGGDFTRSLNQGLIMQAAMVMVQEAGVNLLPNWLFVLLENAWTDLSTEELLTFAAASYYLSPEDLTNIVLPGSVARVSGASVVILDDDVEATFRDLDDGLLEPG